MPQSKILPYRQTSKTCQNCKNKFIIEPEDFEFYKKIDVPAPTFCPECRMITRRIFRNERTLYKRKCSLCGKDMISMYSENKLFPVYCRECWWSDKWDSMSYGQDYDFSKPFFEQLNELRNRVPHLSLAELNNKNSPYVNYTWFSNNSYMCGDLGYGENMIYSNACHFVKDSADCSYSKKLELCYECIYSKQNSRSSYLENCENCIDSYFLINCRNCNSCILCENLRNKSYCILNKQYTKEEFKKIKIDFIDGSLKKIEEAKRVSRERSSKMIFKENNNVRAVNCIGDNILNSRNCYYSFNVFKSENCRFVNDIDSDVKDSMDLSGAVEGELMYGGTSVSGQRLFFDIFVTSSFDVRYSLACPKNNNNLFGCVGLNSHSYCILNKQYSEKVYKELVSKIIEHMNKMPYTDKKGRIYKYGEFFPPELSPFGYNETIANEYFPLTKEKAIKQGYNWYDKPKAEYKPTIKATNLPDHIKDVDDSILKEVIECDSNNCAGSNVFRLIPQELKFYKKMNLPLPRFCPDCRHRERIKQRNPLKLWKRKCMCAGHKDDTKTYKNTIEHKHKDKHCTNTFQTTYSPDRKEIVYCEKCYNKEVG